MNAPLARPVGASDPGTAAASGITKSVHSSNTRSGVLLPNPFGHIAIPRRYTSAMATSSLARQTSLSRKKSPVAVLLNPQTDIPLGERDIRVEDYLNDKIQTAADLGDISSLLASVELQKTQLESQVQIRAVS